jgi:hypothetical protein
LNVRRAFALGTLAAALPAGVAASRSSQSLAAFCVLLAGGALLFGSLFAALASARPLPFALRAVLLGLGLAALPLAKLAALLKAVTHHRPLGAVTFAAVALALCLGAVVVAARVLAAGAETSFARGLRRSLVALALVGPALLIVQAAASPTLRGGVFDVALGLGTGALLGLVPVPAGLLRFLELWAIPLWLAVVLGGIAAGFAFGVGSAALASPALAAPISWMLQ